MGEGRTWLDSAFVVNDWYISAYEPLVDSYGKRVGMLYVGFLQKPFSDAKFETLLIIALAFIVITAATVPIFLRWAQSIFMPLERVTTTIGEVESGNLSARTKLPASGDEIGRVAFHLDTLLDQIQERDRQLREWNEELNTRVRERTRDLEHANLKLEATTKQLIMSEKLAAIGEITAGVAHEINNPIAVMQGNLDVIRSVIGDEADKAKVEFRLLDEQIHRISQIVTKLLQFARPEEYAGYVERHAPGSVVADCLPLVQHLLNKTEIGVVREDRASRLVLMNRTELQQVRDQPDRQRDPRHAGRRDACAAVIRRRAGRQSGHRHRGGRHRRWHASGYGGEGVRSLLHDEAPRGHRPWSFHKSDIDQAPARPDYGGKRSRPWKHIPRVASGSRLIPDGSDILSGKSGHFVLGCSAVTHKSLISCIVRFGTWIAHSSSTS